MATPSSAHRRRSSSSRRSERSRGSEQGLSLEGTAEEASPRRRRRRSSSTKEFPVKTGWLVVAFLGLLTLVLLGPLMTYFNEAEGGAGLLARQVGYVSIALLAVWSVRANKVPHRLRVVPWPILVALAWCWLSLSWAIDPRVALRRVLLLSIVIWSVFVMVRQLGYRSTLTLVRSALLLLLLANFVTVLFYPKTGVHQIDPLGEDSLTGDWRGLMGHKNMAGLVGALTILFFSFDTGKLPKVLQAAILALAGVFIWFAQSRTSVAVCLAAIGIGFVYSLYSFRWRPFAVGGLIVCTLVGAIIQNVYADPFLQIINDPAAFTGRTVIWSAMWAYYRNFPFFGAGYGSFWGIGPSSPINQYGRDWLLQVAEGHNGYLDLLVTIGPIGLALCVLAAFVWPVARLLNWRQSRGQTGALLMAIIIFMIGHNATESSLFDRDSIGQVFLMLSLAMIGTVTQRDNKLASGGVNLLAWANRSEPEGGPAGALGAGGEQR